MAENFDSMRRDAILRAREIYSRAKLPHNEFRTDPRDVNIEAPVSNEVDDSSITNFLSSITSTGSSSTLNNTYLQDEELKLILFIIIILCQENVDSALIFALLYLIS